jgi:hypothetical protein
MGYNPRLKKSSRPPFNYYQPDLGIYFFLINIQTESHPDQLHMNVLRKDPHSRKKH